MKRNCCLCTERGRRANEKLFNVPRDVEKRKKWSAICKKELSESDRICDEHFSPSDIRKSTHMVQLKPIAIPLDPSYYCNKQNETIKKENEDSVASISMENNEIKVTIEKTDDCRCCNNPSGAFIQLNECIKTSEGGMERSYKNLLYEIIKLNISMYHDNMMPQQICQKCAVQVETSHTFIHQVSEVSLQYIKTAEEVIKSIELAPESTGTLEKLSDEPLSIVNKIEIKEDKIENESFISTIAINEGSQHEGRNSLHASTTDELSSEIDGGESDEPESLKDFNDDASLARTCDICHNVYKNAKALKRHQSSSHLPDEDKLPCPLCSYRGNRKSALKAHMFTMHGQEKVNEYFKPAREVIKKYQCKLCSSAYRHKHTLRKHVEDKHNSVTETMNPQPKEKKRHLCTVCGKSYSTKWCLDQHTLIHTGVSPFPCEICSKGFKSHKDLQRHRVVHSDEKTHQCAQCDKSFKHIDRLKLHVRFVHSELRPYKCSKCEKSFKHACGLRTHMYTHTGQTPFECKTCGEAFSLRRSLKRHCVKNGHEK